LVCNFLENQLAMRASTIISPEFTGQKFFIGLDVHKKSWAVTIRSLGIEVAHFNQAPDSKQLLKYLKNKFPGGCYFSAYEAGFCGTSYHYSLCKLGIRNMIINAADLPQTDKQKKNKTDLHDSRAIARYLEKGLLHSIHVMPLEQQERRALYRCREAMVKDATRSINRVRSLLLFFGIEIPEEFKDKEYISKRFIDWISKINLATQEGVDTLQYYLNNLVYQRKQVLQVTKKLRHSVIVNFKESYTSLLTVPGIGPITAMGILAETGDLNRFKNPDEFSSYLGLVPSEHSSGDTTHSAHLQPRCNTHLRPLLIEASWLAIRTCPTLLAYYRKHVGKNNKKAIVKVARKLALIAKAVAINKKPYQSN
jgi:transposase